MSKRTALLLGVALMALSTLFQHPFQIKNWLTGLIHAAPQNEAHPEKSKIQVALLLDTSNSMDGLIEQAKSQLWKMVNELAATRKDGETPDIEIALYEYGNSRLSATNGYIRQITPFTTDMDALSQKLFELTTSGGEEYCGWVMSNSIDELRWSSHQHNFKVIFIAGNEPFNQGSVNYKNVCRTARARGITINTIFCGDYQEGVRTFWKDGAECSQGQYMTINKDDQVTHIPTPYDDKIYDLNIRLNKTYIYYGHQGRQKATNQATQDANAMSYGSANVRERAFFKSQSAYNNASWDLVDASKDDERVVEELEEDELPAELKPLNKKERKEYIQQKAKERAAIQKEIQDLKKKAEQHVAKVRREQAGAESETLDNVMIETVRSQVKAKGYKTGN